MEYISLIVNEDAAHDCLADLGKLGVIQFTDVSLGSRLVYRSDNTVGMRAMCQWRNDCCDFSCSIRCRTVCVAHRLLFLFVSFSYVSTLHPLSFLLVS